MGVYLNPLNWPVALGVGLVRLVILLPQRMVMALGGWLGIIAGLMQSDRKLVAQINLNACFPGLTAGDREHLLKENLRNTGRGLLESAMGLWCSDRRLLSLTDVEGLEYLERAGGGSGGLVLVGHVTMLELMVRLVSLWSKPDLSILARRNNNPLLESLIGSARTRHFRQVLDKKDALGLLRALKRGGLVAYAPDQDFNYGSTFADFFGIPAATVTATSHLLVKGGASLVPAWCYRNVKGRYQLKFYPPLEQFPSGNDKDDANAINAWLEDRIRQNPDQYLWVHRRFKTRPQGQPDFYQPEARRAKHR